MAKTKSNKKSSKSQEKSSLSHMSPALTKPFSPPQSTTKLLEHATDCFQQGDTESAVPFAQRALGLIDIDSVEALPALNLLGEIHVELGDIEAARAYFQQAVEVDEDGEVDENLGGGAEKFMWLAQLSEEGGRDSVEWYERGASVLRKQIQDTVNEMARHMTRNPVAEADIVEKERKLAVALCGIVEVYMTDLSWEEDVERICESLVTEATMVAPNFAEPWQTLASVRISQVRIEDAKAALRRSMELWKDLPPEHENVPDFPTRVSLARLLMEADMEEEAIEVLERLVGEDDTSVEVWYLGGWGLYVMGEKQKGAASLDGSAPDETYKISWISSRQWLSQSIRLFEMQDYEDERLGEHARELIALLDADLGGQALNGQDLEEDDESYDEDNVEDEDEEMTGA